MAFDLFGDNTQFALSKMLDATIARQRTIANNIANVETPGYKRVYVPFENELRDALKAQGKQSSKKALTDLTPARRTDNVSPCKPDGNNVNIDAEMADLAKNQLKNRAVITLIQNRASILRAAVTEGKK